MTSISDPREGGNDADRETASLWSDVQRRVAEAHDEKEADTVGKGPLTALLAEGSSWRDRIISAARDDPRLACALAHSSAGPQMYELLGRERVVEAYIRFAQPTVPGWWDGWSSAILDGLVQEQPVEGWAALVAIAEAAPDDQVLADLASSFLLEIIERRADVFAEMIVTDTPTHPKLRRALNLAVRDWRSTAMVPSSPAMHDILAALAENGSD